jgi:hypothetical protein
MAHPITDPARHSWINIKTFKCSLLNTIFVLFFYFFYSLHTVIAYIGVLGYEKKKKITLEYSDACVRARVYVSRIHMYRMIRARFFFSVYINYARVRVLKNASAHLTMICAHCSERRRP